MRVPRADPYRELAARLLAACCRERWKIYAGYIARVLLSFVAPSREVALRSDATKIAPRILFRREREGKEKEREREREREEGSNRYGFFYPERMIWNIHERACGFFPDAQSCVSAAAGQFSARARLIADE